MKTTNSDSENGKSGVKGKITPRYDCIKLGIDWHARQYRVSRIIDNASPEPAQRFTPEAFLWWVQKQLGLAKEVRSCYETGAGGFVLHRQLVALGVKNIVVAAFKLDRENRGVQTDKTDARDLVMELDRLVRGNKKALRPVFVPTGEQEQKRVESRQRAQLQSKRLGLAAQGRSLLLTQGWPESNQWWKERRWAYLQGVLPAWLLETLGIYREIIQHLDEAVASLRQRIEKVAPKLRPRGLGAQSLEEITREVGDFERFKNRKAPGSYAGLTGGVSATDQTVYELSITKAGNRRLRTMLIEAAWRWIYYQPQSNLGKRWHHPLLNPKASRRARKRAIVALARQLLVELWRWQTGRSTPEQMGWKMIEAH
jgi:transposase